MRMDSSSLDPKFGALGPAPQRVTATDSSGTNSSASNSANAASASPFARMLRSQAAARQAETAATRLGPDAAAMRNTGRKAALVEESQGADQASKLETERSKDSRRTAEPALDASGNANGSNPALGLAAPPAPPTPPADQASRGEGRRSGGPDGGETEDGEEGASGGPSARLGPSAGLGGASSSRGLSSAGGGVSRALASAPHPGSLAGQSSPSADDPSTTALGAARTGANAASHAEAADTPDSVASLGATQGAAAPEASARPSDGSLPSLGAAADSPALPTNPNAADAAPAPARSELPMPPGAPGFAPALGAQLRTWLRDGIAHARLELHPRELGPIDVRIALQDGRANISLAADLASTRLALSEALPQLSAQLGDVGLNMSAAGVSERPQADTGAGPGPQSERQPGARLAQTLSRLSPSMGGAEPALAGITRFREHRGVLDLFA